MTYALGRRIGFADRDSVNAIVDQITDENYGLRSLIHAIVQSETFRAP